MTGSCSSSATTPSSSTRRPSWAGPGASRCWWPGGGDVALSLVREHRPDAILLDTALAGIDGLALLEELKRQTPTRHIPVHIISGGDQRQSALSAGAVAYLQKPVSPDDLSQAVSELMRFVETAVRRVLVVEDDDRERSSIMELVGGDDQGVEVVGVGSSEEAMAALDEQRFDCMVLDLKLPRTSGFALLEQLKADERFSQLPVIVYTGKELTRREETRLKKYAETIIVKDVRSPERLLDETALFLHRVEAKLPGREAADDRAAPHGRRRLPGQAGAHRRRRRAQRVRPHQCPRGPGDGRRLRRERPGRASRCWRTTPASTWS